VRTLVGRARRLGGPGVVIAGVAIDVTELRQAEQAHRDRDRAEQANRAKSEFLSQMNHELRTPLNAVLGFSQLLLLEQAGSLTPQQRRQVQHIEAAGAHLLALISDALDHERIEARRPALSLEAVTLAPLLQESLAMVRTQALERNITLLPPAVGDPACQLWADRTRLLQVLINLLTNAIKYNRPGGTVALQVQRDPAQDQACVQVLDTGLGMRQDQLEQLFQPFNRLGREHSLVEGSGIGLALSRQLVQEMGGRIEVSSTSAGSVFQVWLPVASPA
jgi:signal transduction histidine kinase